MPSRSAASRVRARRQQAPGPDAVNGTGTGPRAGTRSVQDRETVHVALGPRSYDVLIGAGLLPEAGRLLASRLPGRSAIVVTDSSVAGCYLDTALEALREAGFACSDLVVRPGEGSKDLETLAGVLESILGRGIERTTVLVALGGGVVGDLTGFAASILLRGVPFVQIPTTLLAQVDSGVGGKTGVNSSHGKNLIGSFYQPRLVLADVATLATLPLRERRAGYAEIVKYGLIDDPAFFGWLEEHGQALIDGDEDLLRAAVAHACRAKARIVAGDERESGTAPCSISATPSPTRWKPRQATTDRSCTARRWPAASCSRTVSPPGSASAATTRRRGSRPISAPSGCRAGRRPSPPSAGTRRR